MSLAIQPAPAKAPRHRISDAKVAPDGSATGNCSVCGPGARLYRTPPGWTCSRRVLAAQGRPNARARNRAAAKLEHPAWPGWTRRQVWTLSTRFGLTPADWEAKLAAQGHRCAIDGCEREPTCLDHDHDKHAHDPSGHRGIVCPQHNTAIGLCRDSSRDLRATARYVDRYQAHFEPELCEAA
jgi:hypothetical protein